MVKAIFFNILIIKAAKDVSDFHAAWDLAEVTTSVNLVSLTCCITGFGMKSKVGIFLLVKIEISG